MSVFFKTSFSQQQYGRASLWVILICALLAILVGAFIFWGKRSDHDSIDKTAQSAPVQQVNLPQAPVATPPPLPEPEPEVIETYRLAGELPTIDTSDAKLKAHLNLVNAKAIVNLLEHEQVLRKFVVLVDQAAKGDWSAQHLPVIAPDTAFKVEKTAEADTFYIDKDSFQRFTPYMSAIEEMPAPVLLAFYRYYEPLLETAYQELGYPEGAFRLALVNALQLTANSPRFEGDIELTVDEANYNYVDEQLASLPAIQKLMIRVGPDNADRLRSLSAELLEKLTY